MRAISVPEKFNECSAIGDTGVSREIYPHSGYVHSLNGIVDLSPSAEQSSDLRKISVRHQGGREREYKPDVPSCIQVEAGPGRGGSRLSIYSLSLSVPPPSLLSLDSSAIDQIIMTW